MTDLVHAQPPSPSHPIPNSLLDIGKVSGAARKGPEITLEHTQLARSTSEGLQENESEVCLSDLLLPHRLTHRNSIKPAAFTFWLVRIWATPSPLSLTLRSLRASVTSQWLR